jgi:hypothetical protein
MLLLLHGAVATAAACCRSRPHRFTHDLLLADVLLAVLAEHGLVVEGNAGTQN